MIWLVLVVAVVLVALTVAAVLGRVDGSLDDATTTLSHEPLPEAPLTPGDLADLRFDTALRGYRMNQVDGVVDRLRRELADLDDEVARLRRPARGPVDPADPPDAPDTPVTPDLPNSLDPPDPLDPPDHTTHEAGVDAGFGER
ncbi:MAG: DivIVA domain-containing protein [Lapillicoccus sp.]